MKLEIKLPDNTLKTAGGREVCLLLESVCKVVEDWALATKSPVSISRGIHWMTPKKDFGPAV